VIFGNDKQNSTANELEQKFADTATRAAVVINSISDGIAAIDQQGVIQLFNPSAAEMTGWSISDATSLDYRSVFQFFDKEQQPLESALNPITGALASRQPISRDDLYLLTHSQKHIQVNIQVVPVDQAGGVIVTFRDITRQSAEEHEQTEFISTASHEMRTPVAVIEGYLGMLLNPATATIDDRAREYATKAHEAAQHLGHLFKDLLDVTKADDSRINSQPRPIDAAEAARQAVSDFTPAANEKGLRLTFDDSHQLQPIYVIDVDPDQLQEVLGNILENAIKYTPSGGIEVETNGDEKTVRISVTDSGIGIATEDLPHLFQKFYRVDSSDTRQVGGTGLGLYLIKKLTESMGGQVGVKSQLGQGSTFWVEFPRLSRDQAMLRASEVKAANNPGTAAN
jgi:PAS domain S-box-containing protein